VIGKNDCSLQWVSRRDKREVKAKEMLPECESARTRTKTSVSHTNDKAKEKKWLYKKKRGREQSGVLDV